ncbi:hypothetical protein Tco_0137389, partial [Tanacetum coccineum]
FKERLLSKGFIADLEVAFRKSTCYIRDLKGNDLLTGGDKSVSWSSKKKECTSMSSAEAEQP